MPEINHMQQEADVPKCQIHLESIDRLSNMPCVGTTINKTSEIYGKVKESSIATKMILGSAEHSIHKAALLMEPVVTTLEKPIKITDKFVCSTIDYVGEKIPKVVETQEKPVPPFLLRCCSYSPPPVGPRTSIQEYLKVIKYAVSSVPVQPALDCVKAVGSYGVETVNHFCTQLQSENQNQSTQADETT